MGSTDAEFLTRLTMRRLAELNKTRAKVEDYERRAALVSDYELERRKLAILTQLSSSSAASTTSHYTTVGLQLRDMGLHIAELKQYLQSVYDADVLGDSILKGLATEHCISYTVRMLDVLSDTTKIESRGSLGVLELAASTVLMFSGRPSAVPVLLQAGIIPVIARLLSPLFPPTVVSSLAKAVANMADDLDARLAFRAHGGVSALVRLLRPDVEPSVQAAAAGALALLSARDLVVQDSVRYLGGIDLLVALLASDDVHLAEVARQCLVSVRHGNSKNQRETAVALRASADLSRDMRKLTTASDLLRYEDGSSSVRSLIEELDAWSAKETVRLRTSIDSLTRSVAASTTTFRPATAATNVTPPRARTPIKLFDSGLQRPSSASTLHYTATATSVKDYNSFVLPASPGGSVAPSIFAPAPAADDWKLGTTLVELESELLRKKHLARFTPDEVCLLLEELGFDALDLRGFRISQVSGSRLLGMTDNELSIDMLLVRSKVHKVQQLQRATHLFDRIATVPRQGRISEIELRLYLASQGASSSEVNKVVKLLRTLVRTDRFDFITFWDFVTGFEWVGQAFRIYNIQV